MNEERRIIKIINDWYVPAFFSGFSCKMEKAVDSLIQKFERDQKIRKGGLKWVSYLVCLSSAWDTLPSLVSLVSAWEAHSCIDLAPCTQSR